MTVQLTPWYPAEINPIRDGFYIVNHPKGNFISGDEVVAKFTRPGYWERPVGWPSPKEGHGFCTDCAQKNGRVFDPDCRLYAKIEPTEWRGMTTEVAT